MTKIIKSIPQILGWILVGYVMFFFAWFLLATACVQEGNEGCGDNTMTDIVRVAYGPIVRMVAGK